MICVTTPLSPDPLPLPRPPPPPPPPPPKQKTKDKQQEAARAWRRTGMWCAGELTSARKHGIPIIPLYCDGYAFPDADSINNIQSVWTEEQQYTLTSHGISMEDIKALASRSADDQSQDIQYTQYTAKMRGQQQHRDNHKVKGNNSKKLCTSDSRAVKPPDKAVTPHFDQCHQVTLFPEL